MIAIENGSKTQGVPGARDRAPVSGRPFALALRDGLADVAYAFDGELRPLASMSAAERAAYGLRHAGAGTTGSALTARPRTDRIEPMDPLTAPDTRRCLARSLVPRFIASDRPASEPARANDALRSVERADRVDVMKRRGVEASVVRRPVTWFRARARLGTHAMEVAAVGTGRSVRVASWTR